MGQPAVLAKGVVAFDLAADSSLVYSNGRAVYRLHGDEKVKLVSAESITRVAALAR